MAATTLQSMTTVLLFVTVMTPIALLMGRTIYHATGERFHTADNELGPSSSIALNSSPLNQLVSLFQDKFTDEQLATILDLASNNFDDAMGCLLSGPNLQSILKLMFRLSKTYPVVKLQVDDGFFL